MSSESDELTLLKKQLRTHNYRTCILNFQVIAFRYNSRFRFLLNDQNCFHLNNCMWSVKNAQCGPDTCHCSFVLDSPETFFEAHINKPEKYYSISDLHKTNNTEDNQNDYKPYFANAEEESVKDFYYCRVLDSKNIMMWYELYKKKAHALQFQIKVRELKKENQIDAVYNVESKEWHLTDCERSIQWQSGPDTCHCQTAMKNPWKYLKQKYNFVDMSKFLDRLKNQKIPIYYGRN